MREVRVGNRMVGAGHPGFVVAEIGSNHDQSLQKAKEMIRIAALCGANAVKFQSVNYDEMVAGEDPATRALYEKIKLEHSWYPELKSFADQHEVLFFSCPCYLHSIELMESINVAVYKIASPQTLAFPQVIRAVARTGKPLIISTGYSDNSRIARAVNLCKEVGNENYILLQCTSQYPASPEDIHLAVMDALRQRYECPVGFSDHSLGIHLAVAAVARGANVIEKHFTLDHTSPGPDHAFAIEPAEFRTMVMQIRDVERAIGAGVKQVLPEEQKIIETYQLVYRLVAARDLKLGEIIDEQSLLFKRAPDGIPAEEEGRWKGKALARSVSKNTVLHWQDFGSGQ